MCGAHGMSVRIPALGGAPAAFLVLMAHDRAFAQGVGDGWVEDRACLEQYFQKAGGWPRDRR